MKPKDLIEKIREILQKVHDDALKPYHSAELGYSERAVKQIADLIQSVGEELIGRDEADEDRLGYLDWLKKEYRNDLRSEQRSRLAEIISEIKKEEK